MKSLYESLAKVEEEAPKGRRRVGAVTTSIALIANNNGTGVVLECDGPIEHFLEVVSRQLDDCGLDDAPEGISIWEGCVDTYSCGEYGSDIDSDLVGSFRPLTDHEWTLLKDTGTPWLFEDDPAPPPVWDIRAKVYTPEARAVFKAFRERMGAWSIRYHKKLITPSLRRAVEFDATNHLHQLARDLNATLHPGWRIVCYGWYKDVPDVLVLHAQDPGGGVHNIDGFCE